MSRHIPSDSARTDAREAPPSPSTQLYISAEHSKVMSSTIGPGPKYDPLDSVGVAPLSINRTLPRVGFSSVDRSLKGTTDASMFVTDPLRKPGAPPGPGAYDHKGAVGKQCLSPKPSKPAYTICLLYTSPSPRDKRQSRMPSSA